MDDIYDAADQALAQHADQLAIEQQVVEAFRKAMSTCWTESEGRAACWASGIPYRQIDPHDARRAA